MLRKAFRGLGTNERMVIDVLANRDRRQRMEIGRVRATDRPPDPLNALPPLSTPLAGRPIPPTTAAIC
jgi:hypothetical protein